MFFVLSKKLVSIIFKWKLHNILGGKVGRSNATSTKCFSVESYKSELHIITILQGYLFWFRNAKVKLPQRPIGKMNISLLFRPSVIKGPWINT